MAVQKMKTAEGYICIMSDGEKQSTITADANGVYLSVGAVKEPSALRISG